MRMLGVRLAIASIVVVSLGAFGGTSAVRGEGEKGKFSHPTRVDNEWSPLVPGTQLIYEGRAAAGGSVLPHRLVFTVSGLTKVIHGVRTRVLWDRDFDSGQLAENELFFNAQDDAGNVWNFGEYPEIYDNGKLTGAPDTWISGIDGARKGIAMLGNPRVGTPAYRQGFSPNIGFDDRAKVDKTDQKTCVPAGCFNDVLVTREWSADQPTAFQFKYYAPGLGNVRVEFSGTDKDQETLVLIKVVHLGEDALERVNRDVRTVDRRGYRVSPDVYAHTPPIE